MSYDVSIGNADFNYTWNLSDFFRDHIHGDDNGGGINELHSKSGAEAFILLRDAMESINSTYCRLGVNEIRRRYDAPNGWGSVIGAVIFLAQIMAACAENADEVVEVS